jgi:hypothetical protein
LRARGEVDCGVGKWTGQGQSPPSPHLIIFAPPPIAWPREASMRAGGRARTPRAIRGHANWSRFGSGLDHLENRSHPHLRCVIRPRFCSVRLIRTRGREMDRRVGDALRAPPPGSSTPPTPRPFPATAKLTQLH